MQINQYRVTFTNGEKKIVSAHEFSISGHSVIFTRKKMVNALFAVGIHKEILLAISGSDVSMVELVEDESNENQQ